MRRLTLYTVLVWGPRAMRRLTLYPVLVWGPRAMRSMHIQWQTDVRRTRACAPHCMTLYINPNHQSHFHPRVW